MLGRIKYISPDGEYGYIATGEREQRDLAFYPNGRTDLAKDMTVEYQVKTSGSGSVYAVNIVPRTERNLSRHNTEDKQQWCEDGMRQEMEFVANTVPRLGRDIIINPEKQRSKFAIDLYDKTNRRYADLKTQNTPFFTAHRVDGRYDPQYTVTFNRKDYLHYAEKYPDCDIYFHVEWTQLTYGQDMRVEPMDGVWVARFADMRASIEGGQVPLHPYQYRVVDEINARDSYLFDLRDPIFTRLL